MSSVSKKDIKDISDLIRKKLELYMNVERRETRFDPRGKFTTTPKMHKYDFLYKVLDASVLDQSHTPRKQKQDQTRPQSSRHSPDRAKSAKRSSDRAKSSLVRSSHSPRRADRRPNRRVISPGNEKRRRVDERSKSGSRKREGGKERAGKSYPRPDRNLDESSVVSDSVHTNDASSSVQSRISTNGIKPRLEDSPSRVVLHREKDRLSNYATKIFSEVPVDEIQLIHRYRPSYEDNGEPKYQGFSRHVGSILRSKNFVQFYNNEALHHSLDKENSESRERLPAPKKPSRVANRAIKSAHVTKGQDDVIRTAKSSRHTVFSSLIDTAGTGARLVKTTSKEFATSSIESLTPTFTSSFHNIDTSAFPQSHDPYRPSETERPASPGEHFRHGRSVSIASIKSSVTVHFNENKLEEKDRSVSFPVIKQPSEKQIKDDKTVEKKKEPRKTKQYMEYYEDPNTKVKVDREKSNVEITKRETVEKDDQRYKIKQIVVVSVDDKNKKDDAKTSDSEASESHDLTDKEYSESVDATESIVHKSDAEDSDRTLSPISDHDLTDTVDEKRETVIVAEETHGETTEGKAKEEKSVTIGDVQIMHAKRHGHLHPLRKTPSPDEGKIRRRKKKSERDTRDRRSDDDSNKNHAKTEQSVEEEPEKDHLNETTEPTDVESEDKKQLKLSEISADEQMIVDKVDEDKDKEIADFKDNYEDDFEEETPREESRCEDTSPRSENVTLNDPSIVPDKDLKPNEGRTEESSECPNTLTKESDSKVTTTEQVLPESINQEDLDTEQLSSPKKQPQPETEVSTVDTKAVEKIKTEVPENKVSILEKSKDEIESQVKGEDKQNKKEAQVIKDIHTEVKPEEPCVVYPKQTDVSITEDDQAKQVDETKDGLSENKTGRITMEQIDTIESDGRGLHITNSNINTLIITRDTNLGHGMVETKEYLSSKDDLVVDQETCISKTENESQVESAKTVITAGSDHKGNTSLATHTISSQATQTISSVQIQTISDMQTQTIQSASTQTMVTTESQTDKQRKLSICSVDSFQVAEYAMEHDCQVGMVDIATSPIPETLFVVKQKATMQQDRLEIESIGPESEIDNTEPIHAVETKPCNDEIHDMNKLDVNKQHDEEFIDKSTSGKVENKQAADMNLSENTDTLTNVKISQNEGQGALDTEIIKPGEPLNVEDATKVIEGADESAVKESESTTESHHMKIKDAGENQENKVHGIITNLETDNDEKSNEFKSEPESEDKGSLKNTENTKEHISDTGEQVECNNLSAKDEKSSLGKSEPETSTLQEDKKVSHNDDVSQAQLDTQEEIKLTPEPDVLDINHGYVKKERKETDVNESTESPTEDKDEPVLKHSDVISDEIDLTKTSSFELSEQEKSEPKEHMLKEYIEDKPPVKSSGENDFKSEPDILIITHDEIEKDEEETARNDLTEHNIKDKEETGVNELTESPTEDKGEPVIKHSDVTGEIDLSKTSSVELSDKEKSDSEEQILKEDIEDKPPVKASVEINEKEQPTKVLDNFEKTSSNDSVSKLDTQDEKEFKSEPDILVITHDQTEKDGEETTMNDLTERSITDREETGVNELIKSPTEDIGEPVIEHSDATGEIGLSKPSSVELSEKQMSVSEEQILKEDIEDKPPVKASGEVYEKEQSTKVIDNFEKTSSNNGVSQLDTQDEKEFKSELDILVITHDKTEKDGEETVINELTEPCLKDGDETLMKHSDLSSKIDHSERSQVEISEQQRSDSKEESSKKDTNDMGPADTTAEVDTKQHSPILLNSSENASSNDGVLKEEGESQDEIDVKHEPDILVITHDDMTKDGEETIVSEPETEINTEIKTIEPSIENKGETVMKDSVVSSESDPSLVEKSEQQISDAGEQSSEKDMAPANSTAKLQSEILIIPNENLIKDGEQTFVNEHEKEINTEMKTTVSSLEEKSETMIHLSDVTDDLDLSKTSHVKIFDQDGSEPGHERSEKDVEKKKREIEAEGISGSQIDINAVEQQEPQVEANSDSDLIGQGEKKLRSEPDTLIAVHDETTKGNQEDDTCADSVTLESSQEVRKEIDVLVIKHDESAKDDKDDVITEIKSKACSDIGTKEGEADVLIITHDETPKSDESVVSETDAEIGAEVQTQLISEEVNSSSIEDDADRVIETSREGISEQEKTDSQESKTENGEQITDNNELRSEEGRDSEEAGVFVPQTDLLTPRKADRESIVEKEALVNLQVEESDIQKVDVNSSDKDSVVKEKETTEDTPEAEDVSESLIEDNSDSKAVKVGIEGILDTKCDNEIMTPPIEANNQTESTGLVNDKEVEITSEERILKDSKSEEFAQSKHGLVKSKETDGKNEEIDYQTETVQEETTAEITDMETDERAESKDTDTIFVDYMKSKQIEEVDVVTGEAEVAKQEKTEPQLPTEEIKDMVQDDEIKNSEVIEQTTNVIDDISGQHIRDDKDDDTKLQEEVAESKSELTGMENLSEVSQSQDKSDSTLHVNVDIVKDTTESKSDISEHLATDTNEHKEQNRILKSKDFGQAVTEVYDNKESQDALNEQNKNALTNDLAFEEGVDKSHRSEGTIWKGDANETSKNVEITMAGKEVETEPISTISSEHTGESLPEKAGQTIQTKEESQAEIKEIKDIVDVTETEMQIKSDISVGVLKDECREIASAESMSILQDIAEKQTKYVEKEDDNEQNDELTTPISISTHEEQENIVPKGKLTELLTDTEKKISDNQDQSVGEATDENTEKGESPVDKLTETKFDKEASESKDFEIKLKSTVETETGTDPIPTTLTEQIEKSLPETTGQTVQPKEESFSGNKEKQIAGTDDAVEKEMSTNQVMPAELINEENKEMPSAETMSTPQKNTNDYHKSTKGQTELFADISNRDPLISESTPGEQAEGILSDEVNVLLAGSEKKRPSDQDQSHDNRKGDGSESDNLLMKTKSEPKTQTKAVENNDIEVKVDKHIAQEKEEAIEIEADVKNNSELKTEKEDMETTTTEQEQETENVHAVIIRKEYENERVEEEQLLDDHKKDDSLKTESFTSGHAEETKVAESPEQNREIEKVSSEYTVNAKDEVTYYSPACEPIESLPALLPSYLEVYDNESSIEMVSIDDKPIKTEPHPSVDGTDIDQNNNSGNVDTSISINEHIDNENKDNITGVNELCLLTDGQVENGSNLDSEVKKPMETDENSEIKAQQYSLMKEDINLTETDMAEDSGVSNEKQSELFSDMEEAGPETKEGQVEIAITDGSVREEIAMHKEKNTIDIMTASEENDTSAGRPGEDIQSDKDESLNECTKEKKLTETNDISEPVSDELSKNRSQVVFPERTPSISLFAEETVKDDQIAIGAERLGVEGHLETADSIVDDAVQPAISEKETTAPIPDCSIGEQIDVVGESMKEEIIADEELSEKSRNEQDTLAAPQPLDDKLLKNDISAIHQEELSNEGTGIDFEGSAMEKDLDIPHHSSDISEGDKQKSDESPLRLQNEDHRRTVVIGDENPIGYSEKSEGKLDSESMATTEVCEPTLPEEANAERTADDEPVDAVKEVSLDATCIQSDQDVSGTKETNDVLQMPSEETTLLTEVLQKEQNKEEDNTTDTHTLSSIESENAGTELAGPQKEYMKEALSERQASDAEIANDESDEPGTPAKTDIKTEEEPLKDITIPITEEEQSTSDSNTILEDEAEVGNKLKIEDSETDDKPTVSLHTDIEGIDDTKDDKSRSHQIENELQSEQLHGIGKVDFENSSLPQRKNSLRGKIEEQVEDVTTSPRDKVQSDSICIQEQQSGESEKPNDMRVDSNLLISAGQNVDETAETLPENINTLSDKDSSEMDIGMKEHELHHDQPETPPNEIVEARSSGDLQTKLEETETNTQQNDDETCLVDDKTTENSLRDETPEGKMNSTSSSESSLQRTDPHAKTDTDETFTNISNLETDETKGTIENEADVSNIIEEGCQLDSEGVCEQAIRLDERKTETIKTVQMEEASRNHSDLKEVEDIETCENDNLDTSHGISDISEGSMKVSEVTIQTNEDNGERVENIGECAVSNIILENQTNLEPCKTDIPITSEVQSETITSKSQTETVGTNEYSSINMGVVDKSEILSREISSSVYNLSSEKELKDNDVKQNDETVSSAVDLPIYAVTKHQEDDTILNQENQRLELDTNQTELKTSKDNSEEKVQDNESMDSLIDVQKRTSTEDTKVNIKTEEIKSSDSLVHEQVERSKEAESMNQHDEKFLSSSHLINSAVHDSQIDLEGEQRKETEGESGSLSQTCDLLPEKDFPEKKSTIEGTNLKLGQETDSLQPPQEENVSVESEDRHECTIFVKDESTKEIKYQSSDEEAFKDIAPDTIKTQEECGIAEKDRETTETCENRSRDGVKLASSTESKATSIIDDTGEIQTEEKIPEKESSMATPKETVFNEKEDLHKGIAIEKAEKTQDSKALTSEEETSEVNTPEEIKIREVPDLVHKVEEPEQTDAHHDSDNVKATTGSAESSDERIDDKIEEAQAVETVSETEPLILTSEEKVSVEREDRQEDTTIEKDESRKEVKVQNSDEETSEVAIPEETMTQEDLDLPQKYHESTGTDVHHEDDSVILSKSTESESSCNDEKLEEVENAKTIQEETDIHQNKSSEVHDKESMEQQTNKLSHDSENKTCGVATDQQIDSNVIIDDIQNASEKEECSSESQTQTSGEETTDLSESSEPSETQTRTSEEETTSMSVTTESSDGETETSAQQSKVPSHSENDNIHLDHAPTDVQIENIIETEAIKSTRSIEAADLSTEIGTGEEHEMKSSETELKEDFEPLKETISEIDGRDIKKEYNRTDNVENSQTECMKDECTIDVKNRFLEEKTRSKSDTEETGAFTEYINEPHDRETTLDVKEHQNEMAILSTYPQKQSKVNDLEVNSEDTVETVDQRNVKKQPTDSIEEIKDPQEDKTVADFDVSSKQTEIDDDKSAASSYPAESEILSVDGEQKAETEVATVKDQQQTSKEKEAEKEGQQDTSEKITTTSATTENDNDEFRDVTDSEKNESQTSRSDALSSISSDKEVNQTDDNVQVGKTTEAYAGEGFADALSSINPKEPMNNVSASKEVEKEITEIVETKHLDENESSKDEKTELEQTDDKQQQNEKIQSTTLDSSLEVSTVADETNKVTEKERENIHESQRRTAEEEMNSSSAPEISETKSNDDCDEQNKKHSDHKRSTETETKESVEQPEANETKETLHQATKIDVTDETYKQDKVDAITQNTDPDSVISHSEEQDANTNIISDERNASINLIESQSQDSKVETNGVSVPDSSESKAEGMNQSQELVTEKRGGEATEPNQETGIDNAICSVRQTESESKLSEATMEQKAETTESMPDVERSDSKDIDGGLKQQSEELPSVSGEEASEEPVGQQEDVIFVGDELSTISEKDESTSENLTSEEETNKEAGPEVSDESQTQSPEEVTTIRSDLAKSPTQTDRNVDQVENPAENNVGRTTDNALSSIQPTESHVGDSEIEITKEGERHEIAETIPHDEPNISDNDTDDSPKTSDVQQRTEDLPQTIVGYASDVTVQEDTSSAISGNDENKIGTKTEKSLEESSDASQGNVAETETTETDLTEAPSGIDVVIDNDTSNGETTELDQKEDIQQQTNHVLSAQGAKSHDVTDEFHEEASVSAKETSLVGQKGVSELNLCELQQREDNKETNQSQSDIDESKYNKPVIESEHTEESEIIDDETTEKQTVEPKEIVSQDGLESSNNELFEVEQTDIKGTESELTETVTTSDKETPESIQVGKDTTNIQDVDTSKTLAVKGEPEQKMVNENSGEDTGSILMEETKDFKTSHVSTHTVTAEDDNTNISLEKEEDGETDDAINKLKEQNMTDIPVSNVGSKPDDTAHQAVKSRTSETEDGAQPEENTPEKEMTTEESIQKAQIVFNQTDQLSEKIIDNDRQIISNVGTDAENRIDCPSPDVDHDKSVSKENDSVASQRPLPDNSSSEKEAVTSKDSISAEKLENQENRASTIDEIKNELAGEQSLNLQDKHDVPVDAETNSLQNQVEELNEKIPLSPSINSTQQDTIPSTNMEESNIESEQIKSDNKNNDEMSKGAPDCTGEQTQADTTTEQEQHGERHNEDLNKSLSSRHQMADEESTSSRDTGTFSSDQTVTEDKPADVQPVAETKSTSSKESEDISTKPQIVDGKGNVVATDPAIAQIVSETDSTPRSSSDETSYTDTFETLSDGQTTVESRQMTSQASGKVGSHLSADWKETSTTELRRSSLSDLEELPME